VLFLQSSKGLLKEYGHPKFVANAFEKGMFSGLCLRRGEQTMITMYTLLIDLLDLSRRRLM